MGESRAIAPEDPEQFGLILSALADETPQELVAEHVVEQDADRKRLFGLADGGSHAPIRCIVHVRLLRAVDADDRNVGRLVRRHDELELVTRLYLFARKASPYAACVLHEEAYVGAALRTNSVVARDPRGDPQERRRCDRGKSARCGAPADPRGAAATEFVRRAAPT